MKVIVIGMFLLQASAAFSKCPSIEYHKLSCVSQDGREYFMERFSLSDDRLETQEENGNTNNNLPFSVENNGVRSQSYCEKGALISIQTILKTSEEARAEITFTDSGFTKLGRVVFWDSSSSSFGIKQVETNCVVD